MNPTDCLLAIEAIKQLKARYFRYVDTKDWDGLAGLFAADARFDRSGAVNVRDPWTGSWKPPLPATPDIRSGRDGIVRMIRAAVEHVRTVHHGYMPEIEILDDVTAKGIWAMQDEIRDLEHRLVLRGCGHYHETYERGPAGWLIKTARISRIELLMGVRDGLPERYV
jgi:hypothetical protein